LTQLFPHYKNYVVSLLLYENENIFMMASEVSPEMRSTWQVPAFSTSLWLGQRHSYCVVIPVVNEGARIVSLLDRMAALKIYDIADIIIVDGGSTDGSLALVSLKAKGVRGLLLKTGPGKLSAQLRSAYSFALDQGYAGIVSIDGNDKDDPEAIPRFIDALKDGYDFVQASRFISGGTAENTPKSRDYAIRFIHAPLLSLSSGFHWTDTTQGFRAYSRKMMLDTKVSLFRDVFLTYELLAYLSHRAPKLGYRCVELPTIRRYPKGQIPTKISSFKGNLSVLKILLLACIGAYNPCESETKVRK
jgi:dolichol-phosphate mannosyltransferase